MGTASHLLQRGKIWYYRFVIPKKLRPQFDGASEIRRSLGTKDRQVAEAFGQKIHAKVEASISRARSKIPNPKLIALQAEFDISPKRVPLQERTGGPTECLIPFVIHTPEGVVIELDPSNAAAVELASKLLMPGREQNDAVSPLAVQIEASSLPVGLPCSVVTERYLQANQDKWVGRRTKSDYAATLHGFIALMGDVPVTAINRVTVDEYKLKLGNLSPLTKDKKLVVLKGLIEYAVAAGHYLGDNPVTGQLILKKKDKVKRKGWREFTKEELAKIFEWTVYSEFNTKPHQFFSPLIGLYTGARLNEICQLKVSDLVEDSGVWYFDINDEDEDQAVKTLASVRKTPIHPELIRIGLLNYRTDVMEACGAQALLFPYLTDGVNGYGRGTSRHFGAYLDKLKITGKDKVFHSLRKSANNLLKHQGVDEEIRCQLIGHAHDSINSSTYSTPHSPGYLLNKVVIPFFNYPGLDLSRFRYEREKMLPGLLRAVAGLRRLEAHRQAKALRAKRAGAAPQAA